MSNLVFFLASANLVCGVYLACKGEKLAAMSCFGAAAICYC